MSKVLVVLGVGLGWNCVIGVFNDKEAFMQSAFMYDHNEWQREEGKEAISDFEGWFIKNDTYIAHWKDLTL